MGIENNISVTFTAKPERTLEMVAAEIRTFTAGMLNNMIEIGRRLVEAREMLPHGEFIAWVTENTGYSRSQANNLIRIFEEYAPAQGTLFGANVQTFGHLPYSKALALLAVPAEERAAFADEVDAEHISVRELKQEIEKYRCQQNATQAALDAERNRSAELQRRLDSAATQDEIHWAKVREEERQKAEAFLDLKIAAAKDSAEQARKDVETLRASLEKAKTERDKYKNGADEAARKAAEKAVASMQAKLNEAEKRAGDAAERAKMEAAELQSKLDAANSAAQAASEAEGKLRQELSEAKRAAGDGSGKSVAQFELLFQQSVATANQMRDIMLTVRQTDAETATRLATIMLTLADAVKEAAK